METWIILLLLVVVVARWLSELRHNSAALVAADVVQACRGHRRWRSKADRTCLVDGGHHQVSASSLLDFFGVIKLTY